MTTDPMSFTRFQRMLLGTDGTVTHILEAYADEAIDVVKLVHEFDLADDGDSALDLPAGEQVLRRQVVLRGRRSGQNLLYAEAVVALGRVEPAFIEAVISTDKPIGVLLAESRSETFREILRVNREPAGSSGAHFGLDAASEMLTRNYLIWTGGRPIILITEKFPSDLFRSVPA